MGKLHQELTPGCAQWDRTATSQIIITMQAAHTLVLVASMILDMAEDGGVSLWEGAVIMYP